VRDPKCLQFLLIQMRDAYNCQVGETKKLRGGINRIAADYVVDGIYDWRDDEAKCLDAARNQLDLLLAVFAGVFCVRLKRLNGQPL
jgi:hypothetical protein